MTHCFVTFRNYSDRQVEFIGMSGSDFDAFNVSSASLLSYSGCDTIDIQGLRMQRMAC